MNIDCSLDFSLIKLRSGISCINCKTHKLPENNNVYLASAGIAMQVGVYTSTPTYAFMA
jgi:hypothetical protein